MVRLPAFIKITPNTIRGFLFLVYHLLGVIIDLTFL